MRAADALCTATLRFAARRWPAEVRAELARAWDGELQALRLNAGLSPAARAYRQLRFSLSLAVSRPAEPLGDQAGLRWRETALGMRGPLARSLAWLAAPLLGAKLVAVAEILTGLVQRTAAPPLHHGTDPYAMVPAVAASSFGIVVGFGATVLIGRQLARGWSLSRAGRPQLLPPVLAVAAGIVAGAFVTDASAQRSGDRVWGRAEVAEVGAGVVAWLALGWLLIVVARRIAGPVAARSGRRRIAVSLLGGLVGLAFADIAVAAACLPILIRAQTSPGYGFFWLPLANVLNRGFDPELAGFAGLVGNKSMESLATFLVAATALGLGYGLTRPVVTEPATSVTPAAEPKTLSVVRAARTSAGLRALGFACAGVALAIWAPALAVLTPAQVARAEAGWSEEQSAYLAWAHDLRHAAVVLLVLGVLAGSAVLGRVVAGAVAATVTLLGVDILLDVHRVAGLAAIAISATAGLGVIGAGWGWSRLARPSLRAAGASQYRRVLAGGAVVAAYCAPTVLFRGSWTPPALQPIPVGLPEATAVVVAMLVALAVMLASSAREAPLPDRRTRVLVAGSAAIAGGFAYAMTFGGPALAVALGPAFATALLALARGRPAGRSRSRFVVSWTLIGMAGTVAAIPLLFLCVVLPGLLAGRLDLGGDHSGDAFSVLPGAVLVGTVLALVAVPLAIRPARGPAGRLAPARAVDPRTLPAGLS